MSLPPPGNVGDIDPPCELTGHCLPDDFEAELRREQRAQLAETYCDSAGGDYEGGSEACFAGVMDGSIEVDPADAVERWGFVG